MILGECEVKHGVRVHVVNLYTEELGNPEAAARNSSRQSDANSALHCTITHIDRRADHRRSLVPRRTLHFLASAHPDRAAFCKRTDASSSSDS